MSHRHIVTLIYGTPASNLSSAPTPDSDEDTPNHDHQAVWTSGRLAPMVEGSADPFTGHWHALEAGKPESGDDEPPESFTRIGSILQDKEEGGLD